MTDEHRFYYLSHASYGTVFVANFVKNTTLKKF